MNYLHEQMICVTHLHDCVNSYSVIIFMSCKLLYFFDMFHVLLPGDSLKDLWNGYMYISNTTLYTFTRAELDFIHFQEQNYKCGAEDLF